MEQNKKKKDESRGSERRRGRIRSTEVVVISVRGPEEERFDSEYLDERLFDSVELVVDLIPGPRTGAREK